MTAAPTLNGTLEVALYVDDVTRAVKFYERVLGLTVLEADARLTAMAAGRQIILVCLRGASVKLPKTAHDAKGPQHVAFSVAGVDLPAWEAHLQASGVDIVEIRAWAQRRPKPLLPRPGRTSSRTRIARRVEYLLTVRGSWLVARRSSLVKPVARKKLYEQRATNHDPRPTTHPSSQKLTISLCPT